MNVKVIIGLCVVMCVSFFSCSQDEEMYSCNPEVNAWVAENKETYANISRSEFAVFTPEKQSGLFVSFVPEKKASIYQQKYQYLMSLNIFSKAEQGYITELFQRVTPEIYSSESERLKFVEFSEKWTGEVQEKFGWTDYEVYKYTHTWLTSEEFDQWIEYKRNSSTLKSTKAESDCTCRYSISCVWGLLQSCVDGGCKATWNCGIASSDQCTGTCQ